MHDVGSATTDVLEVLQQRLPPDAIQYDPDVVVAYVQDRALFESAGTAAILVMPTNTEQVVVIVDAATQQVSRSAPGAGPA